MKKYDVVVIGAGPAGGQCARQLANAGKKVLIVEKAKDFSINNYSSGGSPLAVLEAFKLPSSVIGTYWNKIALYSSQNEHTWSSQQPLGIILDFMKLRHYLTDETIKQGGDLWLDCSYISHEQRLDQTYVYLKKHASDDLEVVQTHVIVDATGSERSVLAKDIYNKRASVASTGIEYHVEVNDKIYQHWANKMSFFIGQRWMPQGYAWIFPTHSNILKVGVIRYFLHEQVVPHNPIIRHYIEQMMLQCFDRTDLPIHDIHGKTLYYTPKQRDLHFHHNIIAIGDAISSLNPLAAEGIRHAMNSGNIASRHIVNFLDQKNNSFISYPQDLKRYFGIKWKLSETMMNCIYREIDDAKVDLIVKAFKKFSFQDLISLGFGYQFQKGIKFFFNYKCLTFWHWLKKLSRKI